METTSTAPDRSANRAIACEQRLRVVSLVANLYVAGDANRLLAYARAVDRSRVDHSVLLLVKPDAESIRSHGPMLERFTEHGIRVDSLDETPRIQGRSARGRVRRALGEGATFWRILRRLRSYFREQAVDVVDARPGYGILFGALAGRAAGVPVICATEYGTEFWRDPILWAAGQISLRLVDVFVSDSDARIDQYRDWCRLGLSRTAVIENGIFTPRSSQTAVTMRRELGLPEDPRVRIVGQVSRLVPYKGHRILIEAARQVIDTLPDVAFLICGFPHVAGYREELIALTQELGIQDRVKVTGYPGPIADVWQVIDVHAHASLYDSSPIAIHESMALGRPAVVTDVGGIPALVAHEETGLVVPAGDPAAFAAALVRVLTEPGLGERLGAAARERFAADYRAERMAQRSEDLFREILTQKRGLRASGERNHG